MTSTRYPGKSAAPLCGRPMIRWVVDACQRATLVQTWCVAVPIGQRDTFSLLLADVDVHVCGGPEDDVLARYIAVAAAHDADVIVRITGDCPLLDSSLLDECVDKFLTRNVADGGPIDYLSTSHPERRVPSGFDVEVMSRGALRRAVSMCGTVLHHEHVTMHFYDPCTEGTYRVAQYPEAPRRDVREKWSVDTPEDLARVEARMRGDDRSRDDGRSEAKATTAPTPKPTVRLRAIEHADLSALRDWRNEWYARSDRPLRQWFPLNMDDQEAWFARIQRRDKDIMFAVEATTTIGVVGLTGIDWVNQRAEASIYLHFDCPRRQGYGEAALRALCDYGFKTVNLHCVYAEIFDNNEASRRLFEKVGFTHEGFLRERYWIDGVWVHSRIMSLLSKEWRAG